MKHYYIYYWTFLRKYCLYYVNRNTGEYTIIKVFSNKVDAMIYGKLHGLTVNK